MAFEPTQISISFWGTGPATDRMVGAQMAEHARSQLRLRHLHEQADAVASEVRQRILTGQLTAPQALALLDAAPAPPAPGLRRRLAASLRHLLARFHLPARTQPKGMQP